jgi:hypothetical protein
VDIGDVLLTFIPRSQNGVAESAVPEPVLVVFRIALVAGLTTCAQVA